MQSLLLVIFLRDPFLFRQHPISIFSVPPHPNIVCAILNLSPVLFLKLL